MREGRSLECRGRSPVNFRSPSDLGPVRVNPTPLDSGLHRDSGPFKPSSLKASSFKPVECGGFTAVKPPQRAMPKNYTGDWRILLFVQ